MTHFVLQLFSRFTNELPILRDDLELGKLKEELLGAKIAELNGGLLVLTTSLYLDDGTYAEALMLDDVAFAKGGRRRGRDWG